MQVRVLVEVTDTRRGYTPGEVVTDMPEDQAARWIEAGLAEAVGAAPAPPEAATLAPAPETATLPRGQKR
jgi:hypothetical protein